MLRTRSNLALSLHRSTGLGLAGLLALLCLPDQASAQTTAAEKPPPNVLLLVDSSGSMEFKTDGTFPTCIPGNNSSEKSRWIELVEVLTGTINPASYSCWAQDRNSVGFLSEFSLGSVNPYDYGYVNPYHRALSGTCLYGPGVVPPTANPYAWPDRAVNKFELLGGAVQRPPAALLPSHTGCNFDQASDGLLDIYRDQVRFGLMTFDARVGAGTGISAGLADYANGFDGNWSYPVAGPPKTGHPAECAIDMVQEVGARNAAAPPWEGRMIGFGPPGATDLTTRNGWIQEVLLSTRPYGATPIAGQLHDARQFLWFDDTDDPFDASFDFGPASDLNWTAPNCRKTILVLLTDGEPNMDLRPFCEEKGSAPEMDGVCPYEKPEDIVSALRTGTAAPSATMAVETYVVGFAMGQVTPFNGTPISCSELDETICSAPQNNDPAYAESTRIQACCTLNKIAAKGGFDSTGAERKAYFAENRAQLRAIFTDILDDVVQVATRTMPVFTSSGGDTQSNGFKFFSAFDPRPNPEAAELWEGVLERKRFVCSNKLVPEEQYNPARGDDFAANINSGAGDPRWFYTVISTGDNRNTIRPFMLTEDDGLTISSGNQVLATQPSALAPLVPAAAMNVTASTCGAATAEICRSRILNHAVGLTNDVGETRCPNGTCRVFGGIYHSTPTVVPGRPSEQLRDDSYEAFELSMAQEARPSTLYVSTVDGFLHAFNLAPYPGSAGAADREIDTQLNNELWAFIPPAVLPVMQVQYPRTPSVLLDGIPVIKEVVAFDDAGTDRFERTQADAQAGTGLWRTVMVSGFGVSPVEGGYFAIDITKPDRTDAPVFRWQLTRNTDADNTPLFGVNGTPLITTVFIDSAVGGPREVAVAVLPGGDAEPASTAAGAAVADMFDTDPSTFRVLRAGRDYTGREAARSLTIVRLDTGEVLRTFRPASGQGPFDSDVFTATDIPAPITGTPRAFPELAGAVADRIFVGDRDGRMWRVDVSAQDPDLWTMEVFFDAFALQTPTTQGTAASSQPVYMPPVLSVNDDGLMTVAYATGDQIGSGTNNRVISLTEDIRNNEFITKVNWVQTLSNGERVTGPLVLFNRGLYYAASRMPDTSTAACDVGSSTVYGAHFETSLDEFNEVSVPEPMNGPAKAPGAKDLVISSRTDGMVFGVSLESEPSCASADEVIDGNSSFGYGEVRMSKQVNPGRFFLTFEVSGSNADSRGVLEVRQQLETPRIPVSFESWALVYE